MQFAFIPTTKSKCASHLHLGREESICEVPLRSVGRASSAYPPTPLLVFHANFRDRSTPDTEFLPLKALTNLIFPDPSHHKLFWAKIRISKSDEENFTRAKRSATSFTQTHPASQVRPLPGQDTPPAAEPLEPRAPRRQGGGRAGQTATLQNLIRIPTVGLQFFRAGMGS